MSKKRNDEILLDKFKKKYASVMDKFLTIIAEADQYHSLEKFCAEDDGEEYEPDFKDTEDEMSYHASILLRSLKEKE